MLNLGVDCDVFLLLYRCLWWWRRLFCGVNGVVWGWIDCGVFGNLSYNVICDDSYGWFFVLGVFWWRFDDFWWIDFYFEICFYLIDLRRWFERVDVLICDVI